MKIKILIFFMCIFSITNAQNIEVVGGGSMSEDNISSRILKNGNIRCNIPKHEDDIKVLIFSYNLKEKNDLSNGKTRMIIHKRANPKHSFVMDVEKKDIWFVLTDNYGNDFGQLRMEAKNINIKLYPFETQQIVKDKNIPLAIALNDNNTVSKEYLNRALTATDIKKIDQKDINYIRNNSTYFEIITLCIIKWIR